MVYKKSRGCSNIERQIRDLIPCDAEAYPLADHKQPHLPVKEYPIAVPALEALGGVYGVVGEYFPANAHFLRDKSRP